MANDQVVNMGSRRELFVDDFWVEAWRGGARQALHHPQPREIVLTHDRPWEGNTSGYHTFFRDGERVRAYYRGSQANERIGGKRTGSQVVCTAESDDGISWRKPALGLFQFKGSGINNITHSGIGTHNFAPFKDTHPDCPPDQQYKALGGSKREGGLFAFVSKDGMRWSLMSETPVIVDGKFDSQNLAFWDGMRGEYRAYYRDFKEGVRDIKTATSKDFIHWSEGQWLEYPGAPAEQIYTNQVLPYFRAPHIFLGFPTRYLKDRGQITEGLFMSSRDGNAFHRWGEAFIRPGLNQDRWGNRCNYIWHGLIETASDLPGAPNELSLYSTEHYYEGNANRVRRFALRMDGFVSVNAPLSGGEILTRPLTFDGECLSLNVSTSAAGTMRVEIQDIEGRALAGFALTDCDEIWGDEIERIATWKGSADLSALKGRPVRLRVALHDANLYSFCFTSK